jgi:hypothetical protein
MKMDATQKQKMRRVAVIHLALSLFALLALLSYPSYHPTVENANAVGFQQYQQNLEGYAHLRQYLTWKIPWDFLWLQTFQLLQPQTLLIGKTLKLCFGINFFVKFFWLVTLIQICCAPIWSLCFGWIYVKFTEWLNHFPVLGKKVFSNRKS